MAKSSALQYKGNRVPLGTQLRIMLGWKNPWRQGCVIHSSEFSSLAFTLHICRLAFSVMNLVLEAAMQSDKVIKSYFKPNPNHTKSKCFIHFYWHLAHLAEISQFCLKEKTHPNKHQPAPDLSLFVHTEVCVWRTMALSPGLIRD
jgi:hypothetical protein